MQTGSNAFSGHLIYELPTTVWKKDPTFHKGTPFGSNVDNRGLAGKESTCMSGLVDFINQVLVPAKLFCAFSDPVRPSASKGDIEQT